ncbi:MAG: type II toxin-antitoxin system RelE/ParE family toxin [Campylobacterota bacterium]|nr:type II toxin-antitoxin system RelE/ParE family toxin [Campylobacterota bacterium]
MKIIASNKFIKFKKKCIEKLQIEIDKQVKRILENLKIGELKTGDLQNIRVLKFKFQNQLFLLSYEIKDDALYLYTIESHQNYYKELKQLTRNN